jgi:hypothetical protein
LRQRAYIQPIMPNMTRQRMSVPNIMPRAVSLLFIFSISCTQKAMTKNGRYPTSHTSHGQERLHQLYSHVSTPHQLRKHSMHTHRVVSTTV